MKPCSILLSMHVYIIYANAGNENENYIPYMAIAQPNSESMKTFNFGDLKSLRKTYYITMHMCPAESEQDRANLECAAKYSYKIKYCLFKKVFRTNKDRYCNKEVKPIFHQIIDHQTGKAIKCGYTKQPHISLHAFSFYSCGEPSVLDQFQNESIREDPKSWKYRGFKLKVYTICYDTLDKKVIWTKHTISTPQLFQNPYLKHQHLTKTEISTDPFFLDEEIFTSLRKQYNLERMKPTSIPGIYRMKPRPLVPPEHFAILHWKMATNHYINMAPLWDKLVPLMIAIDEGIKTAQLQLASKASKSRNPKLYDDLVILNKVTRTTVNKVDTTTEELFNTSLFESNIWYKFVFRTGKKLAVLIIIHNTPEKPPLPLKGCIVGKQKNCNFYKWTRDDEVRRGITEDVKKYASCCQIQREDVKYLFYDFFIKGYFEIDSLIIKHEDDLVKQ